MNANSTAAAYEPDEYITEASANTWPGHETKMRAAYYESYGDPSVVEVREIEKPVPGDNDVLVRVHATIVSAGDTRMRAFDIPALFRLPGRFMLGWPAPKKPVLGYAYSGIVDSVGKNVAAFRPGDAVLGGHVGGAHAEYNRVPANGPIAKKPAGLSFETAGTIAFGPSTALAFLRKAKVGPGTRLLVIGASGSVGSHAVQIARHLGAEVTAVCSGANAELVTSLGALRIVDYTKEDVRELGEKFDVVFETIGSMAFADVLPLLAPKGTFVTAVMAPSDIWPAMFAPARKGRKVIAGQVYPTPAMLSELAGLFASGTLKPVIDSRFTLDTIGYAHARVDTKRKRGDVVVKV
ncbi:MAG TPA: NAD(P)-dependent alcohol dehydrogenase [Devosia sp.]|nr:NAD(P)-dependent alcohol dehydrogenase [Devosia sp.]